LSSIQTPTDSISFTQSTTISNLASPTQNPTKSLSFPQTSTNSVSFTQSTTLPNLVTSTQTPTESPSSNISPTSTQESSGINSASTQDGKNINVGAIIGAVTGSVLTMGLVIGVGAYAVSKGWFGGVKKPLDSTTVASWGSVIAVNAVNPIHGAMAQQIVNDQDDSNYNDYITDTDIGCVGCVDKDMNVSDSN
jgi:hypothetical protein